MNAVHIVVAMKPIEEGFADNALKLGLAGINIEGCRVGTEKRVNPPAGPRGTGKFGDGGEWDRQQEKQETTGRFPANLIHDGSDEVVGLFPDTRARENTTAKQMPGTAFFGHAKIIESGNPGDSGSSARFFKECKV